MNTTPQAKVNIVLDASKIDLFETCPARYNFRHNHNKVLPMVHGSTKRDALDLGTLAHEGLAVYYSLLAEGKPFAERAERAMMKIRELNSDSDKSHSGEEDVAILLYAIEHHFDYWRADDENCLEVLAVEQPFAYILFEDDVIRIIISGKIDLLVNYNGLGRSASYERLPIDHKTFSRDMPISRKSNQFINYSAAVGSNYLIVNRIGLYDPNVKSPKTDEERFKRIPLSYDPEYIADWKKNLITMLSQEYLSCVASGVWPEKPTSCNKFNRLCEYFSICDSSGQDSKDFKLESQYVTAEEWDVTKGLTND